MTLIKRKEKKMNLMYSKKPLKQTEKQIIFQNNGSIVFYKPKFSKKTWQILLDNCEKENC